ncbi:hypothetical protein RJZ90_007531, partial [Blastomyces dermatitidis]
HEVPNTQDCKLPGKPVQCVEDDTTMSDTSSSSAHSDDTDDDYHASSEEDDPTKPPSKCRRLPTPPSNTASRHPQFRIPRAAAAAGREGVKQEDSKVRATTAKDHYTTPPNTNHGLDTYTHSRHPIDDKTHHCPLPLLARGEAVMLSSTVAQVIFKMVTGHPMTASDLTSETTAAADTERDYSEWKVKGRASAGELLPISKPPTPLETSHRYPSGQPQPADDPATPNAKPRTPSPSSTVTAMCPVCNSVVEVEASSAFDAANNRMGVREQLRFCEKHRKETARREWSRLRYPIIAWDRLDDRLTQFHPRLRRILDDSGYRSRYKSVVHKKVRKHGRKILSWSILHSTGYYGLRGHEILSAHVVSHFKDAIDSLAGIDSVASKYGTVVYAQEVLVPELLEMLVQEDMGVDAKGARWILKESNKIGNLLNLE